jgi:hypothetical protein
MPNFKIPTGDGVQAVKLLQDMGDGTHAELVATANAKRFNDVLGRQKISRHQNIYEADFEYGPQSVRWESLTFNGATVTHLPGTGGVQMSVPTTSGAIAIRQSRPYMRYQPGKTMMMSTAALFGAVTTNNLQRIGIFDDSNGVFFEQGDGSATNPFGMNVVVRSDSGGTITEIRVPLNQWNAGGDDPSFIATIDFARIQMLTIEYAWYGAGMVRFGAMVGGEPRIFHEIAYGNRAGQTVAWARTGNLPVRYELRNVGTLSGSTSLIHYGVAVLVEGGIDEQRGFTYSYGMAPTAPRRNVALSTTRFPVLSVRGRVMGTQEYTQASSAISAVSATSITATGTPWTVDQWRGRFVAYGAAGATPTIARITSNTTSVLTIADMITGGTPATAPVVGNNYTIGMVNRGQFVPRQLLVSADSICTIEIIASTPASPIVLTTPTWAQLSSLGSAGSFAERDVSATSMAGGEVVMAFLSPVGGSGIQTINLDNLFPLANTIRGANPDILTVAISTPSGGAANAGAHFIFQEAMS